ncbi:MAG: hypothetical protein OEY89_18080 [Gammaproteobacteria bacterium]|nr:hypothetical protein [Gammaproteobacteria bacterium]
MNLGLILFAAIGFGIAAIAYWTLFQITLAAWGSDRAKPHWRNLVMTPMCQLFLPLFKWLLPLAGGVFIMALIIRLVSGA